MTSTLAGTPSPRAKSRSDAPPPSLGAERDPASSWSKVRPIVQSALGQLERDPEAFEKAAELLSHWSVETREICRADASSSESEKKASGSADAHSAAAPESSSGSSTNALADYPALSTESAPECSVEHPDWARLAEAAAQLTCTWAPLDAEGKTEAVSGADSDPDKDQERKQGGANSDPASSGPSAPGEVCSVPQSLVEQAAPPPPPPQQMAAHSAALAKAPDTGEPEFASVDEDNYRKKPKEKTLFTRSSTPASRDAIREAKQTSAKLREKLDALRTQKADIKAQRAQKPDDHDLKIRLKKIRKKIDGAQKDLQSADKDLKRIRTYKNDPLGVKEQAHADGKKKRGEQLKQQQRQIEKDLARAERSKNGKTEGKNGKKVDAETLKEKRDTIKKQRDQVEGKSLLPDKVSVGAKTKHEVELYKTEKPLYESKDGSLQAGKLEANASFETGFDKDGFSANGKLEGQATAVEYKKELALVYPWQLFGEDMLTKAFINVRAFVGAEAQAKLEVQLGRVDRNKPLLDGNHLLAGVEGFVGAKASIGVGGGFLWQKKSFDSYKPRLQSSARILLSALGMAGGPLGYLITRLLPTAPIEKVLGWLLDHSSQGTVPLLTATLMGEASLGAGISAKGAIGFRNGQFVMRGKGSATWGLGFGGELDIALDLLEGPMFILLLCGHPEFSAMARRYASEKVRAVLSYGHELWSQIWDWFTADIRARELVAHNVHTLMPLDRRIQLLRDLAGTWCAESDEEAMIGILRDAKQRGDLGSIVSAIGHDNLMYKLTGREEDEYLALVGKQS